jgi:hypothetical protein
VHSRAEDSGLTLGRDTPFWPLKRSQGGLKKSLGLRLNTGAPHGPAYRPCSASIAFGIAVVGAAVTTVRQLNLQTWHWQAAYHALQ